MISFGSGQARADVACGVRSIRCGPVPDAGEPDVLRRPQAYLRYRVLDIPPAVHCLFRQQVALLVAVGPALNRPGRRARLQAPSSIRLSS